jgi:hypothetical protein
VREQQIRNVRASDQKDASDSRHESEKSDECFHSLLRIETTVAPFSKTDPDTRFILAIIAEILA